MDSQRSRKASTRVPVEGKKQGALRVGNHPKQDYKIGCPCEHCACKEKLEDVAQKGPLSMYKNTLDPWSSQDIVPLIASDAHPAVAGKIQQRRIKHTFNFASNAQAAAFVVVNTCREAVTSPVPGNNNATGPQTGGILLSYTKKDYPNDLVPDTATAYLPTEISNLLTKNNPLPVNPTSSANALFWQVVSVGLRIKISSSNNIYPVQGVFCVYQSRTTTQPEYGASIAGSTFADLASKTDAKTFSLDAHNGYELQVNWKYRGGNIAGSGYNSTYLDNVYYNGSSPSVYWGGLGNIVIAYSGQTDVTFIAELIYNVQATGTLIDGSHEPIVDPEAEGHWQTMSNSRQGPHVTRNLKTKSFSETVSEMYHGTMALAREAGGVAKLVLEESSAAAVKEAIKFALI